MNETRTSATAIVLTVAALLTWIASPVFAAIVR